LVSIFGEHLAAGTQSATRFPLPVQMNAARVLVNNEPVPLLFVSPGQINVQLPFNVPAGLVRIAVSYAGSASEESEVAVRDAAPSIFSLDGSGQGQGAILIAGTGLIARATRDAFSRPARRGQIVEIYCNALGPVDNVPAPAGAPAPAAPLSRTLVTPSVVIGGQPAEVLFSGLTPGLVGLYQVNARIAANAATGIAVPVQITSPSASNTVTIAVVDE
jgi:uncharacterized protein (TIGR03437 family)